MAALTPEQIVEQATRTILGGVSRTSVDNLSVDRDLGALLELLKLKQQQANSHQMFRVMVPPGANA